jgi:hypothetical protein
MFPPSTGYLGIPPTSINAGVVMIDDEPHELHNVVVHRFKLRDMDDPDIYAAQPLWEWETSEEGKWVRQYAVETPRWHRQDDPMSFSINYAITAKLKEKDYAIWILKYT